MAGIKQQTLLNADRITISQFYAGRSIFITGGTGFMGKVLIEKLMRSCPDIKNIYVLIRPKRGQPVSARLDDLLSTPIFEKIRNNKSKELTKIIPIAGDITSDQLGISESDQFVGLIMRLKNTDKLNEYINISKLTK